MYLKREKNKPYFKFIILVFLVNIFLWIYKTYDYSIKSTTFHKYEEEISVLQDEVSDLNFRLSRASSLVEIENKALSLGFIKISENIPVINNQLALKSINENSN